MATGQKAEGPDFWSEPSEIQSELGNLTNGQTNPEGPARLTRRLMMDLVFIVIFGTEYTMLSARFRTNNCSQLLDVIRTFSLLDLPLSPRSRRGLIPKACQYQVYCRLTLLWPAEYNSRSLWMLQKRAAPCLVLKRCRPVPQILGALRTRIFANSARPIQLTAAELGDVLEKLTLSQPRTNTCI